MAFIGFLILLFCMALALPHLPVKDIMRGILIMVVVVLGVIFLWYLAVPLCAIWFVFFVSQKIWHPSKPPES